MYVARVATGQVVSIWLIIPVGESANDCRHLQMLAETVFLPSPLGAPNGRGEKDGALEIAGKSVGIMVEYQETATPWATSMELRKCIGEPGWH
jgi:hypothetical protein